MDEKEYKKLVNTIDFGYTPIDNSGNPLPFEGETLTPLGEGRIDRIISPRRYPVKCSMWLSDLRFVYYGKYGGTVLPTDLGDLVGRIKGKKLGFSFWFNIDFEQSVYGKYTLYPAYQKAEIKKKGLVSTKLNLKTVTYKSTTKKQFVNLGQKINIKRVGKRDLNVLKDEIQNRISNAIGNPITITMLKNFIKSKR